MLRKHPVDGFDSEAKIATSRQGCGQDAERNADRALMDLEMRTL
jgi:hypothetical protein